MKKIVIIWEEKKQNLFASLIKQVKKIAKELDMETIFFPLKGKGNHSTYESLKKLDADYLLSFDMAGFEMDTLQEVCAYNILYAKQIHILFQNEQKYREYLLQDMALNLFFFLSDEELLQKCKQEYPHILNLEAMPFLATGKKLTFEQQEKNRKALKMVIEKVYYEVETAGVR
ncbi:MAG: hypothetical protein HDR22_02755 [Lachnospiraceae bacterium]|nr:hypothetical protein [Lachnospiraceae bacterium]